MLRFGESKQRACIHPKWLLWKSDFKINVSCEIDELALRVRKLSDQRIFNQRLEICIEKKALAPPSVKFTIHTLTRGMSIWLIAEAIDDKDATYIVRGNVGTEWDHLAVLIVSAIAIPMLFTESLAISIIFAVILLLSIIPVWYVIGAHKRKMLEFVRTQIQHS